MVYSETVDRLALSVGSFVRIAGKPPLPRRLTFVQAAPKTAKTVSGVLPTGPGQNGHSNTGSARPRTPGPAAPGPQTRGGALARCTVGAVVWPEPVRTYK